jgi:hypothetical protein
MLDISPEIDVNPAYRPFLDLFDALFLTTEELARRWRYSYGSVCNMRRLGTGPSFVRLPGGAIRYRVSEVLAYELHGHGGGLTMERVAAALATCPNINLAARQKIEEHLRLTLCVKV